MNKMLIRLVILLAVIGMVAGGYYLVQQIPEDESMIALAEVKRGDLVVKTFLRGELRAVRSLTLTAPNIGSQSQITQLAPAGALANRGNLIFELDDSERVAALEDSLLAVEKNPGRSEESRNPNSISAKARTRSRSFAPTSRCAAPSSRFAATS